MPLIEAEKTPSRVRPEGLDGNGNRLMASAPTAPAAAPAPSSLPSPISSAMAAATPDGVDLSPQGIPAAPEIVPPVAAAVIELAPVLPVSAAAPAASPPEPVVAEAAPASEPFRLQLATMRSAEGAEREINRLKVLYAALAPDLELSVQRLDQGERGVFYRVLSGTWDERAEATQLCAAIIERRGQCRVLAPSTQIVVAAKPVAPASVVVAAAAAPPPVAAPAPNPAAPVIAAKLAAASEAAANHANGLAGVRAQLASLRSQEGAARELARLKGLHADALEQTELSISKIDQGDRGVFYRILTAPLPDRASASEFCKTLGPQHGCVLVGTARPSA